jgi:competence protein ComEA
VDATIAHARLANLTTPPTTPADPPTNPTRPPAIPAAPAAASAELPPEGGAAPADAVPGWLPASLRTARLVAPRQAIATLVAVALFAVLVTAAILWRSRPRATEVTPPPVLTTAHPSAAPTRAARLVISVVGKVHRPGLVTVPGGSRVADALAAAGGPLPHTDLTALNLARKLTDGEQIVVGVPTAPAPAPGDQPAQQQPSAPLSLNTATLAQLDGLPGVGPVIAQRILDWRTAHGQFTAVDQLGEIDGIGDRTLDRLRPLVTT